MVTAVAANLIAQPSWAQLASQLSTQLQALQETERQLASTFGSLVAASSVTANKSSASSSAGISASAGSSASKAGSGAMLSVETLSALLAATSSASSAASSASEALTTYQADPAVTAATTAAGGTAHLLAAGATNAPFAKPNMAQFMDATGADRDTASEILHGSIGANTDVRDWTAIMKSAAPLADARASTAAMYDSSLAYTTASAQKPLAVVARTQNLAMITLPSTTAAELAKGPTRQDLAILDGQGNILRVVSDPSRLSADARNFGFDASQLSDLAGKLDAAGVAWRTGAWAKGFLG